MGVPRATEGAEQAYRNLPQLLALAKHPERGGEGDGPGWLRAGPVSIPQHTRSVASRVRRVRAEAHVLGYGYNPNALHVAPVRDTVHRGIALVARPRPGPGDGSGILRLDRLANVSLITADRKGRQRRPALTSRHRSLTTRARNLRVGIAELAATGVLRVGGRACRNERRAIPVSQASLLALAL